MKRIFILSLLYSLLPFLGKSQICDIWIVTPTEQVLEVRSRGDFVFADSEYKLLMETAGVTRMTPAFPYSKVEKLKRVYTLRCPIQNIDIIGTSNLVVDIIELSNDSVELYVPSDPMWNSYYGDSTAWLWHLKKTQADLAWDITKGDSSIKIALLDTWFDPNHPDLETQLQMPYDPYDNQPFYSSATRNNHGTCVASFIAAETDGGGELASIGFNCKIIPIKACAGNYMERAHFASLALHAQVLTSSAGGWTCSEDFNEIERIAVKEILDNGTVIVMPAGNGPTGTHCHSEILGRDQPWRPIHPHYDERIIIVSSTDKDDMHYFGDNGIDNTHSHYPEVDICSPGYLTMGAQCTLDANNNPVSWPYYGFCNGTSFATPIVAGVCGLIKSLNPCFAPEDVQDIIKNSADPITDAADFPGLVGAGRINAYQALLLAQAYLVVDTITGNTTWNQKKHLYDDLVIDSLATLTITDTLYIAGGTRIIVRPGGKLIVNGGTLTSACDGEMWQGIIVEGHNNIRQAALAQGSVILNNATIENAWTAISTRGADANAIYEHTGGIVQATNTLFRNNRRSVEFLSYENHTTTHQVTDNASYFTRCTFTVDDDNLFVAQGRNFQNHVTMWQVRGVKFNGCSFHNEMSSATAARGKAISTEEAGFNVKRVCPTISPADPCVCENHGTDTVTRCSFVGFDTAVHTSSTLGNYDITLDNCDFRQDFSGVHLAAADNARVSFCDFNIDHTLRAATGLRSLNTTGYTIEGNNFHRTSYSTRIALGAEIIESGTADNTIRLNGFENLYYACYVSGINGTDGNYRNSGLQFLCNTFSGNKYDIYAYSNGRIRRTQGQLSAGADNDFVNTRANSLTIPSTHDPVTYYRSSGGNHQPIGSSLYYTVLNATTNSCASTICGIHIDNPIVHGLNGGALPQYQSMAEHLGHLQEQYENIQYLESEEAVALQSEMSDLSAAMSELARTEIRGIISDSVPDLALLKDWYKAINTPLTHYLMAETQSTEGLWDKARATLEDIPVRFELNDSEKDEYTQYGSLQSLREAVYGNWYKLSDSQIAQMQQVAESGNGRAARMAKEILCFFHHICYEGEPFPDEMDQTEFGTRGLAVGRTDSDNALTLSPNPANSTVTLQLADPQDEIRQITVANMQGQVMLSQTVNATTPYTLDISALPAGIYVVRVLTANGQTLTGKMVKE